MVSSTLSRTLLNKKRVLAGAAIVLFTLLIRRRRKALLKLLSGRMCMSAMENSMGNATTFPPEAQVSQVNNIVNIYCWYDDCPTEELVAEYFTKVMVNKRFRAVPADMTWTLVDTKASDHVGMHTVPTEEAALELLGEICRTEELPVDKPFWRVEIVKSASGQSVVLIRIHHVIGDGIGLMAEVLPKLVEDRKGQPIDMSMPEIPKQNLGVVGNVLWWVDALRSAAKVISTAAGPFETDLPMLDATRRQLVYSGKRTTIFWPTLSLPYIKKVKDAGKCTVNDLMYSAWAGTVRRYCEKHGHTFDKKAIVRSVLAVAIPRSFPEGHDKEDMLINNFTLVPVDMDVNTTDLPKRLRSNKNNLDVIKKTTLALVSLWFVNTFSPCLPVSLQQKTALDVFARHSVVFSNVPGPKEDINMMGKPLAKMQPVFVNLIPQLLAVSCGDKLWMNVTLDPKVVEDMYELPSMFIEEMDAIGRAFGIEGTCRTWNLQPSSSVSISQHLSSFF